jgi:hypothetical protein
VSLNGSQRDRPFTTARLWKIVRNISGVGESWRARQPRALLSGGQGVADARADMSESFGKPWVMVDGWPYVRCLCTYQKKRRRAHIVVLQVRNAAHALKALRLTPRSLAAQDEEYERTKRTSVAIAHKGILKVRIHEVRPSIRRRCAPMCRNGLAAAARSNKRSRANSTSTSTGCVTPSSSTAWRTCVASLRQIAARR